MKIVSLYSNVNSINGVKYFSQNKKDKNISFGIANSGKLKILFSYGLPCMYSGIEMIDPKKIQNHLKNQNFNKPMRDIIKIFSPYEKSMTDIEGKVWPIIKGYTQ